MMRTKFAHETRMALHKASNKKMLVQRITRTNRAAPAPGTIEWVEAKAASHTGFYL